MGLIGVLTALGETFVWAHMANLLAGPQASKLSELLVSIAIVNILHERANWSWHRSSLILSHHHIRGILVMMLIARHIFGFVLSPLPR